MTLETFKNHNLLGNDEQIFTKFKDLKSAVDYVERASKDRTGWFSKEIQWEDDL